MIIHDVLDAVESSGAVRTLSEASNEAPIGRKRQARSGNYIIGACTEKLVGRKSCHAQPAAAAEALQARRGPGVAAEAALQGTHGISRRPHS